MMGFAFGITAAGAIVFAGMGIAEWRSGDRGPARLSFLLAGVQVVLATTVLAGGI
jgi:hypothetical protein